MNRPKGPLPPAAQPKFGSMKSLAPQSKLAVASPLQMKRPAPPNVYRPQPTPKVLQTKMPANPQPISRTGPVVAPSIAARGGQPPTTTLQMARNASALSPRTGAQPLVANRESAVIMRSQQRVGPFVPASRGSVQLGKNKGGKKSRLEIARRRAERGAADGDEVEFDLIDGNWNALPGVWQGFTLYNRQAGGGQYFYSFTKGNYSGHLSVPAEASKCFHLTLTAPKAAKGNYYFYMDGANVRSTNPGAKASKPFSSLPDDFKADAETLVVQVFT